MNNSLTNSKDCKNQQYNKYVYGAFVLLSLVYIAKHDYNSAASNAGIALIFDPFNTSIPFTKRPTWQKWWLVVHVVFVFAIMAYSLFTK